MYPDQLVKSEVTATPWPYWSVTVTTEVDPSTATQCVVPGAQETGIGGKSPTNKPVGGVTAVHPGKLVGGTEVVVVLEVVVVVGATVVVVLLVVVVGLLVGFRPTTGVVPYIAGVLLILLFAYALSWGFAVIGLSAPNSETAQVMSFPLLFPLTFISSAFVNVHTMPSWLQGFATYQPVSVTVSACRALMIGGATATWVIQSLLWTIGFLIVLIPLASWRYRTRT